MAIIPKQVWRNTATVVGGVVAILAVLFALSLLFFDLVSAQPSPYLGIFAYLVFPVLVVLGAGVALAGLLIAAWRYKRRGGAVVQYYPRIDLNLPSHRRALLALGVVVALALPCVGLMSYQGYHYTESDQFCGSCHSVMDPQYIAYKQSPHARVGCAECHIGAGASWYVKSKLSGIRQVFAVALDTYSRPIPPAIQELRPATETCQHCHWPAKFYGSQLVAIDHYASDEANTSRPIRMLLKTGGADPTTGPPSGIHWHMSLGFSIEYVATDPALQQIPWVRMTNRATHAQAIYRSDGLKASDPPPLGTRREIDCMDCHNRPTHIFRAPQRAADLALNVHPELQLLPYAKRELVGALVKPYATKAEGLAGVSAAIQEAYREHNPEVWQQRRGDIDRLVEVAGEIYGSNFFPEMKVDWRTYPDNIGHKIFPGCFRCHDGKHADDAGKAISTACSTCHDFLTPGETAAQTSLVQVTGFVHPVPLEGVHATLRCDQCHTGGVAPATTCAGCHTRESDFFAGKTDQFQRFHIKQDTMARAVQCTGCHDLSKPLTLEALSEKCLDCHEDEERFGGLLASWKKEADDLLRQAESQAGPADRKLLDLLRKSGPLHNIEGTRTILRDLPHSTASAAGNSKH
ncbi:MAG TPA: cytochrome c3 family protein [Phycisphaerae bacterium]|jgi:nitrate/TMAO reductase-like tetraheme cytochrome c subunit